jgi:hypothetical protein
MTSENYVLLEPEPARLDLVNNFVTLKIEDVIYETKNTLADELSVILGNFHGLYIRIKDYTYGKLLGEIPYRIHTIYKNSYNQYYEKFYNFGRIRAEAVMASYGAPAKHHTIIIDRGPIYHETINDTYSGTSDIQNFGLLFEVAIYYSAAFTGALKGYADGFEHTTRHAVTCLGYAVM